MNFYLEQNYIAVFLLPNLPALPTFVLTIYIVSHQNSIRYNTLLEHQLWIKGFIPHIAANPIKFFVFICCNTL